MGRENLSDPGRYGAVNFDAGQRALMLNASLNRAR